MDLPALLRQSKTGELETPFREPMGVAHSGWAPKMDEEEAAAAEAASLAKHHGTSPDKPSAPAPAADPKVEAPPASEARTEQGTAEAAEGPEKEGGEG